jgi:outer membrane lipoprotein-sorting protein
MLITGVAIAAAGQTSGQADSGGLEKTLRAMDTAAANFRSTEATLVWEQYQKVVNEKDTQKGKVYFRRAGKETQMMVDISDPDQKYVLYADGRLQVYQPKMEQVTVYTPGKSKADVESFLVLGFGGGGHDLQKSFNVTYAGTETIDGVETAKLDLAPKSARVKGMFDHITLWVDPARGVSVQQQFFEPSGDYRLNRYSDIQINQKLPDNAFKLKTTGKTKFVSPQG